MRRRALAATLLLLAILPLPPAGATHVDIGELVQIAPWDALDTITSPAFNDTLYVGPYEEVFGVAIGGEAHTYPPKLMNWHEVINDVVGGVPIVMTLCPLCGSAIAFERTVNGTVLTFRTSGLLYRNNKVMFDTLTMSLWPQILGEAINGTYHGAHLKPLATSRMAYGDWVALHPDAKLVARPWGEVLCPSPCLVPFGFEGYDVNPYARYQEGEETLGPVRHPDDRLHPKTVVVGVVRGDDAWAVAFPDLLARRAVNVVVGGTPLVAALAVDPAQPFAPASAHVYDRGAHLLRADPATNELIDEAGDRYGVRTGSGTTGALEQLPFFYGYWFAWHDHHPETALFGHEPPGPPPFPLGLAILGVGTSAAAVVLGCLLRRRALNKTR